MTERYTMVSDVHPDIYLAYTVSKMPANCGMCIVSDVQLHHRQSAALINTLYGTKFAEYAEVGYDLRTKLREDVVNHKIKLSREFLNHLIDPYGTGRFAPGTTRDYILYEGKLIKSSGKFVFSDAMSNPVGPFSLYKYTADDTNWSFDSTVVSNPNMGHASRIVLFSYNVNYARAQKKLDGRIVYQVDRNRENNPYLEAKFELVRPTETITQKVVAS